CLPLKRFLALIALAVATSVHAADTPRLPRPLLSGLKNPSAVAVGLDGKVYVATQGDPQADGDGDVLLLENGKAVPFARGLDNPQALVAFRDWLFVTDGKLIRRIDRKGNVEVHIPSDAFPA